MRRATRCFRLMHREIFNQINREPAVNGVLDRRLGVSSKAEICQTCGKNIATCPGHFGTIHLVMPVFHIGFINMIIGILRCICKVTPFSRLNGRNAVDAFSTTRTESISSASSSIPTRTFCTSANTTNK